MKELNIFFDRVDEIIEESLRLSKSPTYSYFGKFSKMFYNDAIIVIKRIVKFSLEMKTADSFETYLSKQRSLNALLYRYKYPIGDRCKIILSRFIFDSSCSLETKICKEAMRELKVIASSLFYNASVEMPEYIQKTLLNIPSVDRIVYARLLARDIDARLYLCYANIRELKNAGWDSTYIERDILCLISGIFREFALFDIDLTPIIKINSDYEKYFGTYEYFRDDRFKNQSNVDQKEVSQLDKTNNDLTNISTNKNQPSNNNIWILGDNKRKENTLKILHNLIQNGKAAHASKILKAAIKAGAIIKPTYTQIIKEFPNIGAESGYNNQMSKKDRDEEINPLMVFFWNI